MSDPLPPTGFGKSRYPIKVKVSPKNILVAVAKSILVGLMQYTVQNATLDILAE
jgi:hypothetical protein